MRIDVRKQRTGSGAARDVNEMLRIELERRRPATLEEANEICREVMNRVNSAPQVDFGGLSPQQVFNLTRSDWLDSAVRLNEQLSLAEVSGSAHFHNVRDLLTTVDNWGIVKSTALGAFNRKLVAEMMKLFVMDDFTREYNNTKKAVNQDDVPGLELYRHMLPVCGLLRYQRQQFNVTAKGKKLLANDRVGELYAHLFRAMFVRMNLGALDGLPENRGVQETIGYSLCRLARMPNGWMSINEIASELILPAVRDSLTASPWSKEPITDAVHIRILRHLADFSLVEFDKPGRWAIPEQVRKTPLFSKFISFSLPDAL